MPIYEYRCHECDEVSEVLHKLSDPAPETCPECGADGTLSKLISRSAFHLKGAGWYADGYGAGNGNGKKKSDSPAPSEPKSSSSDGDTKSTSTKTESKGGSTSGSTGGSASDSTTKAGASGT